jgi:hypothetical protein
MPEPAFTPEEEAHYECRKAEAEKPIMERLPWRWRACLWWIIGTAAALAIAAVILAFYLMG